MAFLFRLTLRAGLLAALFVGLTATPAFAKSCSQQVLDDWYDDGNVRTTYPIHCYREALADLPEDVQAYSDAPDVIAAAMQAAIAAQNGQDDNSGGGTNKSAAGGGSGGGDNGGSGGSGDTSGGAVASQEHVDAMEGPTGTGVESSGVVNSAIDKLGPGDSSSFPIALVVLGALGTILIAAGGASIFARRLKTRKPGAAR